MKKLHIRLKKAVRAYRLKQDIDLFNCEEEGTNPQESQFSHWFKLNIVNSYATRIPTTIIYLYEKLEFEEEHLHQYLLTLIDNNNPKETSEKKTSKKRKA